MKKILLLVIIAVVLFSLFTACNEVHEQKDNGNNKEARVELMKIISLNDRNNINLANSLFCFESVKYIDRKLQTCWFFSELQNDEFIEKKSFSCNVNCFFPQTEEEEHPRGSLHGIIDTGEKYIFLELVLKKAWVSKLDHKYLEYSEFPCFFEIGYDGSNLCYSDITDDLPNTDSITSIYYDNSQKKLYTIHFDDTLPSDRGSLSSKKYGKTFRDKQVLSVFRYDYDTHECSLIRTDVVEDDYRVTKGGGYVYKRETGGPYVVYHRLYWYKDYSADNPIVITLDYIDPSFLFFHSAFFHDDYLWVEIEPDSEDSTSDRHILKLKIL